MSTEDSKPPASTQALLQESKAAEQRLAIKEKCDTPSAANENLENSVALHKRLAVLCEKYSNISGDKATIDARLSSGEGYDEVSEGFDAQSAYSDESALLADDVKTLVVEIFEAARSIRSIDSF